MAGRVIKVTELEGEDFPPTTPFARMELRGERFDGGRLPITSLVELERYRALVIAAATERWLAEHPGDPLPDDFVASFELDLVDIGEGSAVSEMEVVDTKYSTYYLAGRDEVEAAFQSIVADNFKAEDRREWIATESFWDFGNTLSPYETLVVREDATVEPKIWINGATRQSRFDRARELFEPPPPAPVEKPVVARPRNEEGTVAGRLNAIDAEKKTFRVDTLRFGPVRGKYDSDELTEDLKRVLDSSARAPVVRVTGWIRYVEDEVTAITKAESVELLEIDGEPWSRRFVELATLDSGWLDGEAGGEPVVFAAMEAARELLKRVRVAGRREPGIFPMEDGGIMLEWADLTEVASVEIWPDLSFHLFHTRRGEGVQRSEATRNIADAGAFVEGVAPA